MKEQEIKTTYEYGAVSSRFSLEATNKFVAYATMVAHYNEQAGMVAIYVPEEAKEDSWIGFDGKAHERIDKLFGGEGAFEKYLENNIEEIKACYKTIKRLV